MAETPGKKRRLVVLSLMLALGLACPALAQSSTSERRTDGSSTARAIYDLTPVNFILDQARDLKLSLQQVQNLTSIRSEFQKQTLKKRADLELAELELDELRAKTPVDLGAVEVKVKQSEALKTELRLDSIRAIETARAKLSPAQRITLEALQKANPVSAGVETSSDTDVQQQVQSILKEQYKDQKVVELETSEAIVTKLMDWAKTFGLVLGVPLAVLGVALGILGIKTISDIRTLANSARENFANTVETGKQDLAKAIVTGKQDVEGKLREAEQTFSTLKTKGDDYLAEYKKIENQLAAVTALAKKVPIITQNLAALTSKVDQIQEQINIDSKDISSKQKEEIVSTLESFQKYFQKIGFTPPKGKIKVRVDAKGDMNNAFYDMKSNLLQIGLLLVDDLDITLHSYAHHALVGVKKEAWDALSNDLASIVEGLADYFTCSFTNKPLVGEKSIHVFREQAGEEQFPHPYLRNLDNSRSFDEVDPKDPRTMEPHNVGEIWGGAFWKLRTLLGHESADKLIFSTWIATQIAPDFGLKFVKKLLELYKPAGDEKNGNRIKAVFKQRGLEL